jgi:hypothetical protein
MTKLTTTNKKIEELEEITYLLKRMIEINLEFKSKEKEYNEKDRKKDIEIRKNAFSDKSKTAVFSVAKSRSDLFILRNHFTSVERKIINKLRNKPHIKKLIAVHGSNAIYNQMIKEHREIMN